MRQRTRTRSRAPGGRPAGPSYVSTVQRKASGNTTASRADVALGQTCSMLMALVVTFDQPVTADAGAFSVVNLPSGVADPGGDLTGASGADLTATPAGSAVVLTFTAGEVSEPSGSLKDGIWRMTVDMTKVHAGGAAGSGSEIVDGIRRLFGDSNGDGDAGAEDDAAFQAANNTSSGAPGYDAAFDSNADGFIDPTDESEFGSRFGLGL